MKIQTWMPLTFLGLSLTFFVIFFFWFKYEPRSIKNGLMINLGIVNLIFAILTFAQKDSRSIWNTLSSIGIVIFVVLIILAIYAGIVLLIWNARILVKPNDLTAANLIVIFVSVSFVLYLIIFALGPMIPNWLGIVSTIIPLFVIYLGFIFFDFVIMSIIANLYRPTLDYSFIIVLGAGLVNGNQISSTLGSRLRRAFEIGNEQYKTTHVFPVIIVSGGKGNDEKISEAKAMRQWLVLEGYPNEYILMEDKSRNTQQNMINSKKIIERSNIENPKVVFVSNSYHLVRAGMYARRANLNAVGIGAKTPGFFVPTGWLREFAAIIMMKKTQHKIAFALLLLLVIIGAIYYQLKLS